MGKAVPEERLIAYGAYTQVGEFLQHYNSIQVTYRTFASSWLLATFVAIGYILSSKEVNLPFHPLVIVSFVALASATGIFLIWYMDLIVCEQSIAATVFEGIGLEAKHAWLPRFYHNVGRIHSLLSYVTLKAIFYIGCLAILLIVMGASLTFYVSREKEFLTCYVPVATLALIGLVTYFLIASMKKADPYQKLTAIKRQNLV